MLLGLTREDFASKFCSTDSDLSSSDRIRESASLSTAAACNLFFFFELISPYLPGGTVCEIAVVDRHPATAAVSSQREPENIDSTQASGRTCLFDTRVSERPAWQRLCFEPFLNNYLLCVQVAAASTHSSDILRGTLEASRILWSVSSPRLNFC